MKKVRRSLRINDTLDDKIEKQREKENRSYNNMVEVLCEKALSNEVQGNILIKGNDILTTINRATRK